MKKKILEFESRISDVKQINPLFSTCKVRILYTGRNRNMSIITEDAVQKALPTLVGIPIVGEFSVEADDFKGHGGAIDLSSYKYIHTTKPYGFVPESAEFEWEEIRGRKYLTISGCYLWTGRYEEALSVVEKGKGQSMEIEVINGEWDDTEEAYKINNFIFSALCILGDDVEPAFEDASIGAYSLDKESFKNEFSLMMSELKQSLSNEKEVNRMEKLKELLAKYSITMEDVTAKGIKLDEISEDELEAEIVKAFDINTQDDGSQDDDNHDDDQQGSGDDDGNNDDDDNHDDDQQGSGDDDDDNQQEDFQALKDRIAVLEVEKAKLESDLEELRQFKLDAEKQEHEAKVNKLFADFQLSVEDTSDLDIHAFSIEEIEEKCYAILGRKLSKNDKKKNFQRDGGIHLPLGNESDRNESPKPYGGLIEKYRNK